MPSDPSPEFIAFITPTRAAMPDAPTPAEAEAVGAHFAYLQELANDGAVALAGRTLEPPHVGLVIIRADSLASARAVMDNDPGIARGAFTATVQAFRTAIVGKKT